MMSHDAIAKTAIDLFDRVKGSKTPYSTLKWIVKNCSWQYKVSQSELWEAYFAAINLLKQNSIENVKRKSLSSLTKQERSKFRKWAREVAVLMSKVLAVPVSVTKMPIRDRETGRAILQIEIKHNEWGGSYFYPTYDDLMRWAGMSESDRMTTVYKFAQCYKTSDDRIRENIETIKANLECLMD